MIRSIVIGLILAPALLAGAADAGADAAGDEAILAAARAADLEYSRHVALLEADLGDAREEVRVAAITAFGPLQDPAAVPLLIPFLDGSTRTPAEVMAAVESLADLGAVGTADAMRKLLGHGNAEVRAAAHNGLERLKAIGAGDHLRGAKDTSDALRGSGVQNLGLIQHAEAAETLKKALAFDARPHIRRLAAIALGRLGDPGNGLALAEALTDSDPGVRRYAAEALVKVDYKLGIPNLLMALEANVAGQHIDRCVELITGQDFGFDAHSNQLERQAAIEKGFVWWAANAPSFR
ncbi:MAG TPA: HEAT repeat domain-containing protein [Planctomycetota bacterium]|nr:HEAT repeat domain-containing protein [Planctomycetota bacterium]